MRLFTAQSIREIEQKTMELEHISSLELMDRAATQFVFWLLPQIKQSDSIILICGKYNNGADGLAIAEKLWTKGYKVQIIVINFTKRSSSEFDFHFRRIKQLPIDLVEVDSTSTIDLEPKSTLIDAILGNGTNRPIEGPYKTLIQNINNHNGKIFSVDIPSGLLPNLSVSHDAIKCDAVLSFQFPKLAFFLIENRTFIKTHSFTKIGLNREVVMHTSTDYYLVDIHMISSLLNTRNIDGHKGTFGHSLMIMGSLGMAGAAILSCKAAMSTGVGMCTALVPSDLVSILQVAVPEVMIKSTDEHSIKSLIAQTTFTIGAGPGLSMNKSSHSIITEMLGSTRMPLVLDADALNIIATNSDLLSEIPAGSILTPHPKEFERMFGQSSNSLDRLRKQQEIAKKYKFVIIVKGRNTTICTPDGKTFINTTGNSGLATAGSGDVLTGIITALLAQGNTPTNSAIIGVFLHGLSGDLYVINHSEYTLTAGAIIGNLSTAINQVQSKHIG